MKPIIVKINEKGELKLTEKELEKMLSDAYNTGYNDGLRNTNTIVYPTYTHYPQPTYIDGIKITCDAKEE